MVLSGNGMGSSKGGNLFSTPSYTTIGEPYSYKVKLHERFGGTQFATNPTKKGAPGSHMNDCFFQPYKRLFEGENYFASDVSYRSQARTNGFLTSDAHKRDEYTNTRRTEQHREMLRAENRGFLKAQAKNPVILPPLSQLPKPIVKTTAQLVGYKCDATVKAAQTPGAGQYARRPIVAQQFFRKGGVTTWE